MSDLEISAARSNLALIWPADNWTVTLRELTALLQFDEKEQCKILRHHGEKDTTDEEDDYRSALDDFLLAISALEVGWMSGWSQPHDLDCSFLGFASDVLSTRAVRRYYTKHYPLRLPTAALFRLRAPILDAANLVRTKPIASQSPRSAATFEAARQQIVEILFDPDVSRFLDFLDAYFVDDYGLPDFLEVLRDPHFVVTSLYSPKPKAHSDRALSQQGVRGMWRFFLFLSEFMELIARVETEAREEAPGGDTKYLASAYWHLFSYWSGSIRENFSDLKRGLGHMKAYAPRGNAPLAEADEVFSWDESQREWFAWVDQTVCGLTFIAKGRKSLNQPINQYVSGLRKRHGWL